VTRKTERGVLQLTKAQIISEEEYQHRLRVQQGKSFNGFQLGFVVKTNNEEK
jgi:hypothetical protein